MDLAVPLLPDPPPPFELDALLDARPARRPQRRPGRAGARRAGAGRTRARAATAARTARALAIVGEREPRASPTSELAAARRARRRRPSARPPATGLATVRDATWRWCSSTSATTRARFVHLGRGAAGTGARRRSGRVDARCAHAEGLVQSRLGEFDLARASFQRALALAPRCGTIDAVAATTLNSLGVAASSPRAAVPAPDGARHRSRVRARATLTFTEARELALTRHADDRLALLAAINVAGALGGLGLVRARRSSAVPGAACRQRARWATGHNESLILANAGEAARLAGQLERARATRAKKRWRSRRDVIEGPRAARRACSFRSPARRPAICAAALAHYKVHHALERETHAGGGATRGPGAGACAARSSSAPETRAARTA